MPREWRRRLCPRLCAPSGCSWSSTSPRMKRPYCSGGSSRRSMPRTCSMSGVFVGTDSWSGKPRSSRPTLPEATRIYAPAPVAWGFGLGNRAGGSDHGLWLRRPRTDQGSRHRGCIEQGLTDPAGQNRFRACQGRQRGRQQHHLRVGPLSECERQVAPRTKGRACVRPMGVEGVTGSRNTAAVEDVAHLWVRCPGLRAGSVSSLRRTRPPLRRRRYGPVESGAVPVRLRDGLSW